jgi:hypothetical protein
MMVDDRWMMDDGRSSTIAHQIRFPIDQGFAEAAGLAASLALLADFSSASLR